MPQKTAYVTGPASGIGRAVAEMLVSKGYKIAIADVNLEGVMAVASQLNSSSQNQQAIPFEVDVSRWESQIDTFEQVVKQLGRVDYVYPIAGVGERIHMPNDPDAKEFVKPDLTVLDVDLYGVVYTCSLAIQQMRRQEKDEQGFRGKIAVVASVCGFYCVPTVPIYTAAKHGVVGYVRSFGKYLPEEGITLNAVCPNVVRTNISTGDFYDNLEAKGLLTYVKPVIDAFEHFLDADISGECMEMGPNGGYSRRAPAEHLDAETTKVMDLIYQRSHKLHERK